MDSFLSFLKWKWPKSAKNVKFHSILTNFGTIWPTQKPLILPTKYFNRLIFSQNTPENSTTRKWIHFYLFWSENDRKVPKMSYFMQFWPILGPYDPLKSPWYYQQSTLNGSYSPKILHKIVLPENRVISIFFDVKMTEKSQNVIFHSILTNFETIWPTRKPLTLSTKYVEMLIFSQTPP